MTNRQLYNSYQSSEIAIRVLKLISFHRDTFHKLRTDRWRLLQRLETSDWRCCFSCFKLHPSHEFSSKDLETAALKRTCMYGPLVSIVCLCPCMNMTFRDKRKLTRILSSLEGQVKSYRIQDGFVDISGSTGHHQCSHSYNDEKGISSLKCEMSITLEECENLVVKNKYNIVEKPLIRKIFRRAPLPCPHESLADHLRTLHVWNPRS